MSRQHQEEEEVFDTKKARRMFWAAGYAEPPLVHVGRDEAPPHVDLYRADPEWDYDGMEWTTAVLTPFLSEWWSRGLHLRDQNLVYRLECFASGMCAVALPESAHRAQPLLTHLADLIRTAAERAGNRAEMHADARRILAAFPERHPELDALEPVLDAWAERIAANPAPPTRLVPPMVRVSEPCPLGDDDEDPALFRPRGDMLGSISKWGGCLIVSLMSELRSPPLAYCWEGRAFSVDQRALSKAINRFLQLVQLVQVPLPANADQPQALLAHFCNLCESVKRTVPEGLQAEAQASVSAIATFYPPHITHPHIERLRALLVAWGAEPSLE